MKKTKITKQRNGKNEVLRTLHMNELRHVEGGVIGVVMGQGDGDPNVTPSPSDPGGGGTKGIVTTPLV